MDPSSNVETSNTCRHQGFRHSLDGLGMGTKSLGLGSSIKVLGLTSIDPNLIARKLAPKHRESKLEFSCPNSPNSNI